MKPEPPPDYKPVIFYDVSVDFKVLTRSTVSSAETMAWEDGQEYPVIRFDLSSASHAFYTGKEQQLMDKGGRIEQFRQRYAKQLAEAEEAAADGGETTEAAVVAEDAPTAEAATEAPPDEPASETTDS